VNRRTLPCLALLVVTTSTGQAEDGNPARGAQVFQHCYSCHSVQPNETNLQGPNLRGIVGRRIAAQEGFPYSSAMRAFAQREERWTEALLDRYLAAPHDVVPKTSMAFHGITDESERAALIAYLRSLHALP
jgi:cytochrome c